MCLVYYLFFFKQKTAYERRISDWSSDVCSSDLRLPQARQTEDEHRGVGDEVGVLEPADRVGAHRRPGEQLEAHRNADHGRAGADRERMQPAEIGRASCRERVCQYG